ncbi:prolyl oligopeptidase family serine peptidase [Candidatus Nephthysia bennettiae]|uniref:prolyl oligopeptidase n=1 Tax=Candidatus Nephthysia bennettiae TaxID=3127016 RepID=A0A934K645_9BACT|nr:S9 family peptidase [Candidatus Dormibacteraeota bacterium]MBJ7611105.1 S9 family peptidase [Candidatus Dormibacteraeota bacterium]
MSRPPASRSDYVVEVLHGVSVHDPYRWLEDTGSEEVSEWVSAQNAHARSLLDALPGRAEIGRRLAEAVDRGALGASLPRGHYRFFARRGPGSEQAALHVAEGDGPPRLLFDPAPLSADRATAMDWWIPSPDGELVCLGVSEGGSEESTLQFVRTADAEVLPDRIARCRWSAVGFEPGNGAILYSRQPAHGSVPAGEEMYHRHVWRHVVGDDPALDVEVFGKGRDKLDFPESISFSSAGGWTVLVVAQGWDRTAVFLRRGEGEFLPIFEGQASELHAWFAGDRLLALTNFQAPNYRLVEIDPERWQPERWKDVVPESDQVLVQAAVADGCMLVHHLADASSRVTIRDPDGGDPGELDLPPFSTVTGLGAHPSSRRLTLTFETFTSPARTIDAGGRELDRLEPPPGFDAVRHPVRQVRVRSRDGTEIPMFLVGRPSGSGPTVLTGYGGFNIARTPLWSPSAVPFLESGGLLAVSCLRGGGEYGEHWHRAGMLGNKQNVFDDFIACAEWLIAAGLTSSRSLGITGGSNGGLLVGAAMTQRPELFGCVVCRVPLLDMVRYQRFKVAQLWTAEYGSADEAEGFGWLHAYSPYHHLEEGLDYPPTLLTTGEEDSRVDPMHARKFAARLQAVSRRPALLRVEPRAGHGQGKPASKVVPEETDIWSFLLDRLQS